MNTQQKPTPTGTLLKSTALLSSSLTHLVVLHRVLYGTIDKADALEYLHSHLRDDADLGDMGRPLKYQYKDNSVIRFHSDERIIPTMNTDNDIQTAINNAGDIGCTYIPDITESEYRSMLISIDALMNRDPDPTTPDGIRLSELVSIVEQYESKHYPSLSNSDVRRIALERDRMRHALQKIEAESHDSRAVDYAEEALR